MAGQVATFVFGKDNQIQSETNLIIFSIKKNKK